MPDHSRERSQSHHDEKRISKDRRFFQQPFLVALAQIFHSDLLRRPGSQMDAVLISKSSSGSVYTHSLASKYVSALTRSLPLVSPFQGCPLKARAVSPAVSRPPVVPHQLSRPPRHDQYEIFGLGMLLGFFLFLSGCTTIVEQNASDRTAIKRAIANETPGHYFIGRRFYKVDYHMWGWVKEPGKAWKESRLVMFNEQKMLAPDRKKNQIGADNNYEYQLEGHFSGEKVYEPASDSFYPEFVLEKATLVTTTPPLIFPDSRWIDPKIRLLEPPES